MRGLTKDNCRVGQVWEVGPYTFEVTHLGDTYYSMRWNEGSTGQLRYDYGGNITFTLVIDFNDYYDKIR